MTDPLSDWWVHEAGVWRLTGSGARGDVYDPPLDADPAPLIGFWEDGSKLVTTDGGEQATSTARFAFPATTAEVPIGSLIAPPVKFGTKRRKVIKAALGDAGDLPTPNHREIALQ